MNDFNTEVERLRTLARSSFDKGDYDAAAEFYKATLRYIRDVRGAADPLIADVFEEFSRVHAASGKPRKCESIRRRVTIIRRMNCG